MKAASFLQSTLVKEAPLWSDELPWKRQYDKDFIFMIIFCKDVMYAESSNGYILTTRYSTKHDGYI